MTNGPETRESMLLRLADPADHQAWCEFTEIYRPLVYRLARRRGLQDADAQDLAQGVLMSVYGTISKWEPDRKRAKFRSWLYTIAKNALIDHWRAKKPDAAQGGTTALQMLYEHPEGPVSEEEIDRDLKREMFRFAAREIRAEFSEDSWLAFWQTAVECQDIPAVARQLRKTIGAVYIARCRVMQRLRAKVQERQGEWEASSPVEEDAS